MAFLSEADIESALMSYFADLGYAVESEENIGPDGKRPERESYDTVILRGRLEKAIGRLNPGLPAEARADAIRTLAQCELPNLLEENWRIHKLLVEGVDVEYFGEDGVLTSGKVRILDFDDPDANDWMVVNQFTVVAGRINRRPDVVVFVNGLPLAVVELKAPGDENATLSAAFNQLQTYKQQIPALFHTNAVLLTSDGMMARLGSLSADEERFMPWRTIDGLSVAPKGVPELSVLTEGVFERRRFLELIRYCTVFMEKDGLIKILAGYHQFHAVRHAVDCTVKASLPQGDKRAGVIWHTKGSGKSLLMAFYAGRLVLHPAMQNPTVVVLTDRNDLDDQLFSTFSMCHDLIRQTPVQAESREDLQRLLNRDSGGVIFTTIQKFSPEKGDEYPVLTSRRNVVVIADEAHRSQYGLKAKVKKDTGEISYGFAKYLRDALPGASFIGFTGTPIEADDVNTPRIFGDYIDIYDISRAVEDGATVPLYYESRLARIELDENERPHLDEAVDAEFEDEDEIQQEALKRKWSGIEALVGSEKRLKLIAEDIVKHFEARTATLEGKGMIVCMSRRICVALYDALVALRPEWHSKDDDKGALKIVMTGSASDPQEWQQHIGTKGRRDLLAKRTRDANDPLKLVIVRDMWLTGFDAPCMHTMYIDKPMRGHGLMQAIARVNRVFRDKPAGLVVDYIGIAQNLKNALSQYSSADREKTGIDEAQAVAVLLEKLDVVRAMYHGFDYMTPLGGAPHERMVMMAEAIEWILDMQQKDAAKEKTPEGKKKAHRRYQDVVLALSKAYALAGASDEAAQVREEVAFFQAINTALVKSRTGSGKSREERDFAIQQIVSRAVVSTEIVDILKAVGITSPDISILSDEFLEEVRQLRQKNLALESLRKLLNDGIRSRSRNNIVQTRAFSERLEDSIARYHSNALTAAEVIQELIELAVDIRKAREQGEESGLTEDEIAFYDALAENKSAVQVMGNDSLKVIAHELLISLRANVSVDWAHRESARARLRVLVKRILRRYGYPPDLQDSAVQTVLQQAEALCGEWVA